MCLDGFIRPRPVIEFQMGVDTTLEAGGLTMKVHTAIMALEGRALHAFNRAMRKRSRRQHARTQ